MKLVIFDIDGTLTDTTQVDEHAIVQALQDVVGVSGLSTDWSEYQHSTDAGIVSEVIKSATGNADAVIVQKVQDKFFEYLESFYTTSPELFGAFPDASHILESVSGSDVAVAIATGSWRESALFKLRVAGVRHHGIPMATADDSIDRSQVIARAISTAQSFYHVNRFDEIIYVADAVWDARASAKLGITFVAVTHNNAPNLLVTENATAVISELMEIVPLLESGLYQSAV